MATIPTASHGSYKNTPRRIYVAAKAFNNDFYTYTVTTDPVTAVTTGALTVVTADANQTPVGRTLREVGRKLYPGANPGITTYMVKVYDDQTGLSGYINPNSATFAIFNTDKPTYMTDGSEVSGGSYSGQNEGNSVYTLGTVTAGAGVVATTGGVTATAGGVTATTGTIRAATVTNSTTTTGTLTIDPTLGQVFTFSATLTGAVALAASSAPAGSVVYVQFTNGGGQTLSAGANVVMNGNATLTNAKRANFIFVSNGTSLIEMSRVVYT